MDRIESVTLTDGRSFTVGDHVTFVLRGRLTAGTIAAFTKQFVVSTGDGWFYWFAPGQVLAA
jgi:hypothetical protein